MLERRSRQNYVTPKALCKNPQVEYRCYWICYLDIQGFKKLVEINTETAINNLLKLLCDNCQAPDIKLAQFSDSMLLARNGRDRGDDDEKVAGDFIKKIAKFQIDIIANLGIAVRGGLTKGLMHWKEYAKGEKEAAGANRLVIFGPGFNRAVELESKIANYPIITIDESILPHIGCSKEIVNRSGDSPFFINYLQAAVNRAQDNDANEDKYNWLCRLYKAHGKIIRQLPANDKNRWLATYHNESIDSLNEDDFRRLTSDLRREEAKILIS